jgi:ferredoxin
VNEPLNVSTAIGQNLIYARKNKGFNVSDACTGCGTCETVCPVANIVMKNKKPSFQHHCEQCMPCVQWCPNFFQILSIFNSFEAFCIKYKPHFLIAFTILRSEPS